MLVHMVNTKDRVKKNRPNLSISSPLEQKRVQKLFNFHQKFGIFPKIKRVRGGRYMHVIYTNDEHNASPVQRSPPKWLVTPWHNGKNMKHTKVLKTQQ
jgi:hypothetical protein